MEISCFRVKHAGSCNRIHLLMTLEDNLPKYRVLILTRRSICLYHDNGLAAQTFIAFAIGVGIFFFHITHITKLSSIDIMH